jgi:hypothetical protein
MLRLAPCSEVALVASKELLTHLPEGHRKLGYVFDQTFDDVNGDAHGGKDVVEIQAINSLVRPDKLDQLRLPIGGAWPSCCRPVSPQA